MTEAEGKEPATGRPLRRFSKATTALLTFTGLVATTIASVSAAMLIVAPQLKPREKLGAELDKITIQLGMPYYSYKSEIGDTSTVDDSGDAREGAYVLVHANILGFKERSYSMDVSLIDARTHKRLLPPKIVTSQTTSTCNNNSPSADEDGLVWQCWIVAPSPGTSFLVRARLYDSGRTSEIKPGPVGHRPVLDFIESKPMTYPR